MRYIKLNKKTVISLSIASSLILGSFTGVTAKTLNYNNDFNTTKIISNKTGGDILLHGNFGDPITIPDIDVKQKTQFRSVWVSTIFNLDFKKTNGSETEFKKEFKRVLDDLQAMNMNAVTFQVRPSNDAFYSSKLNPWSAYLTGKQGTAPDGGFDPLKYMVDETHKRNMEFHAWFNPYRVTASASSRSTSSILNTLSTNNWARKNPQYVINCKGKLLLNPGEPAVQQFIIDTVMEVVKNYDIDAIHFDDYFYPYDSSFGKKGEDSKAFAKYGTGFTDIKGWRRNNIDTLIERLHTLIKQEKTYVKFGISPFGIWGSKAKHIDGSNTASSTMSSYDVLYADTKKWIKSGWIDYITPQIYWALGRKDAPYGELADWWANVVKGTNCSLYIGHAPYRCGASSGPDGSEWINSDEVPNQLKFNSTYADIKGSTFFSLKDMRRNPLGITDRLKSSFFSKPALVPPMPWIDNKAPNKITELNVNKTNEVNLTWKDSTVNDSYYYVVYRFENGQEIDLNNPDSIVAKVKRQDMSAVTTYKDTTCDLNKNYTYVVTSVDRLHNESEGVSVLIVISK